MGIEDYYQRKNEAYRTKDQAKRSALISSLIADLGIDPRTATVFGVWAKIEEGIRRKHLEEKGIVVGSRVKYQSFEAVYTVMKICPDGRVVLKGRKGFVFPTTLTPVFD